MEYILEYLNKLSDNSRSAHMEEYEFDERCISTPFMSSLPFTPMPYESLPFQPREQVFYDDDDEEEVFFDSFMKTPFGTYR